MTTWEALGIDTHGKTNGEHATTCPRCSPYRKKKQAPCLSVNLDKGLYHCNHCEWSGSLRSGDESAPALQGLPRAYRLPSYQPPPTPEATMIDWFAKRGIPRSIVERRQVSTGMIYMPADEAEVRAIQFPYFRDGQCVNIKYRDSHKHFRMVGGAERLLYGWDDVQGESVVICEGELDAMAIELAGYSSVVSVPDGAPAPGTKHYASKFDFLAGAERLLAPLRTIVLAVDSDAPGKTLAAELARRLGAERCLTVLWPAGCKDANEVLLRHGVDMLRDCLDRARPCPVQGIQTPGLLSDAVEALYFGAAPRGVSTGWLELDKFYTVRPGEVTIVTGIPSHGKSAWVSALAINLAQAHGWGITLFSPENAPMERYAAMLVSLWTGKPFWGEQRVSVEDMRRGLHCLDQHISFLMPDNDSPTLDRLLELARIQVYRHGIKGLVLDPWNEIDFVRPAGQTETEYVSACLSKIRRFAMLHGVHVWVVAHPTKLQKAERGKYEGQYPPPTPYDIAGSAHFRNKADNCVTIWRDVDANDNHVTIYVQKVRFLTVGKPGECALIYEPSCGRFREPRLEDQAWAAAGAASNGVASGH
jgi:twinkle protein